MEIWNRPNQAMQRTASNAATNVYECLPSARANPESGPKLPIVSLRLPTSRQKIDQGWSLEALNWDNYVAHVQFVIANLHLAFDSVRERFHSPALTFIRVCFCS